MTPDGKTAGYSGTPLARKLGIKEGHRVATLEAPGHFADLLAPLPAGVRVLPLDEHAGPCDVLVIFVTSPEELALRFAAARRALDPFGGLWVAWPKQSSPRATQLKGDHIRAHGLATGLVDNKVCAMDQDWSGLRFVVRVEDRPNKR